MSYEAIVAKLERVRKHPNADLLNIATCLNNQVIVGLDAKEGDIVLFLGDDGQISKEFASNNNLYSDSILNKDSNKKGYFAENRRIRTQKFRGEKSEAFVIGLDSLKFTGYDINKLNIGDKFSTLNNVPICNKYVTEATIKSAKTKEPTVQKGFNTKELKKYFPEHIDTAQVKYAKDEDFLGLNIISLKYHGSSFRSIFNKLPIELPLKWYEKLWNVFVDEVLYGPKHLFNFFIDDIKLNKLKIYKHIMEWQKLYATRRVVKGAVNPEDNCYRTNTHRAIEQYMQKGEIWYGEIVGYEQGVGGSPIMQTVSIESFKPYVTKEDFKNLKKQFGDTIVYKYGCLPDTCDFYIYRIAVINEDNILYELPWDVVKKRCNDAGIKHVIELERHLITDVSQVPALRQRIEELTEEPLDPIDNSHFREGIVVRNESFDGKTYFRKNKGFFFKVGENLTKDFDVIDTEEQESISDEEEYNEDN